MSLVALRRTPTDPGLAARRLVRDVLAPVAARTEAEGRVPPEVETALRDAGYFGLTIPPEFGGVGLSTLEYLEVVRELARTNLAFEELTEENNGIGSASLLSAGTPEQRAAWLPRLASGEVVGCFALTEPEAGSDAAAIRTTARPVEGGYVLNGRKHFITHGAEAGLVTVVARMADGAGGSGGHTLFLVTPETPGFSVARTQPMMGYRASGQAELLFDDAFVGHDAVLGPVGQGFGIAMQTLDRGRLTVTADCLGTGEDLLDRAIAYAQIRHTFGAPLASRGQVRAMLARSALDLFAVEGWLFDFAERIDGGADMRAGTARLKLFGSEAAWRVADRALQIHGGFGYTVEGEIERSFRDLRVMRIAEGASEVLRATIARSLLRSAGVWSAAALVSPPEASLEELGDGIGSVGGPPAGSRAELAAMRHDSAATPLEGEAASAAADLESLGWAHPSVAVSALDGWAPAGQPDPSARLFGLGAASLGAAVRALETSAVALCGRPAGGRRDILAARLADLVSSADAVRAMVTRTAGVLEVAAGRTGVRSAALGVAHAGLGVAERALELALSASGEGGVDRSEVLERRSVVERWRASEAPVDWALDALGAALTGGTEDVGGPTS